MNRQKNRLDCLPTLAKAFRRLRDLCSWTTLCLGLAGALLAAIPAGAVTYGPPVKLSTTPYNFSVSINDKGQVVWIGGDNDTSNWQIYLYDGKISKNISNNNTNNAISPGPLINANGWVTWGASETTSMAHNVWLYSNGIIQRITSSGVGGLGDIDDANCIVYTDSCPTGFGIYSFFNGASSLLRADAQSPRINKAGQITYFGNDSHIYLISGGDQKLSINGTINTGAKLNNAGQVIWQGYENAPGGFFQQQIYFFDGQTTRNLSNNSGYNELGWHFVRQINDRGEVVWSGPATDGSDYQDFYLYSGGVIKNLTSNGSALGCPQINNKGQVLFNSYDGLCLYSDGSVQVVAQGSTDYSNCPWMINNLGQIAYISEDWPGQVYLISPVGLGQKNADSILNLLLGD